MKIVGIGGGTGLPVLLRGLREFSGADLTAIVAVSDSGGSTGVLRQAFDIPAMGDIRNCLVALAAKESVLSSVCQHRFENPEGFAGHSVGNLILSALFQMSGNFSSAVRQASDMLYLKGCVLPATEHGVTLCASYEDGSMMEGEAGIPRPGQRIQDVWLKPENPAPAAGVIEAIQQADVIVIGPGSLYTSIIPNLLVRGVAEAIQASPAVKIYVCNLMTQPGETDGYTAAQHLEALLSYLPGHSRSPMLCLLNSTRIGTGVAERYLESGSAMISGNMRDEKEIQRLGVVPVALPLLKDGEMKARHDPAKLARLVVSLARSFAGEREIVCGQGNGR